MSHPSPDSRLALRLRALLPWETFAPHQLGASCATGSGGTKDERQALRWYGLGARRGDPESQYDLGFMLLLGEGAPADAATALHWLRRAAGGGHRPAAALLADLLQDGRYGTPVDPGEARRWRRQAEELAARGTPPAPAEAFPFPLLFRAVAVWLLLASAEIVHGTLRRLLLEPLVGDFRSRQIAVLTGSALLLSLAYLCDRWLGARGRAQRFAIGTLWLVLMLTFELAAGRLLAHYSWQRIGSDYDLTRGGLLPLGMAILWLAPLLAERLRIRPWTKRRRST